MGPKYEFTGETKKDPWVAYFTELDDFQMVSLVAGLDLRRISVKKVIVR